MRMTDLAVEAGRNLQSPHTGFVHYCYQGKGETLRDGIPTLENALFALALFRTRSVENVLEGKELLERLLAFEVEGNFPVYLHEYPKVENPYLALRIAPIFFWILHDFSHVIGNLREKLDSSLTRLLDKKWEGELPLWAKARLAAFSGEVPPLPEAPHDWQEALISMQIAEKKGGEIEPLLSAATRVWHPELCIYIGPSKRRPTCGRELELTLFDLYLFEWQKSFPSRGLSSQPIHLRGALIRPLGRDFPKSSLPLPYAHFRSEEDFPYFAAWEGHTLALAKRKTEIEQLSEEEYLIHFPEDLPESEEKSLEVSFYLNYDKEDTFRINGKKANTFRAGDVVEIETKTAKVRLSFENEDGRYFGHVMRGNRPSQLEETELSAYDWRFAIRTVQRSPTASIRVRVQLQALESPPPLPLHASHCPHTEPTQ